MVSLLIGYSILAVLAFGFVAGIGTMMKRNKYRPERPPIPADGKGRDFEFARRK
jgi:hypothetical protein